MAQRLLQFVERMVITLVMGEPVSVRFTEAIALYNARDWQKRGPL